MDALCAFIDARMRTMGVYAVPAWPDFGQMG